MSSAIDGFLIGFAAGFDRGVGLVGCLAAVGALACIIVFEIMARRRRAVEGDARRADLWREAMRPLRKRLIALRDEHLEHVGDLTGEWTDEAVVDAVAVPERHADEICRLMEEGLSELRQAFQRPNFAPKDAAVHALRQAQENYLRPKQDADDPGAALTRLDCFIETIERLC